MKSVGQTKIQARALCANHIAASRLLVFWLVDFLMDDINTYDDAQVGAAARVVHAGCKAALLEHFRISPVRAESEGSTVQVAAGYLPDEYRLVGKIRGPPFSGVLVHHGWKTDAVSLPRVLRRSTDRLPAIAPAEVELK
jgi:hypothetical protein